jgi:hypothetical protein
LSGSAGTIGGSTTEDLIAFGAASADTITKDAGIAVVTKGGGSSSVIKVGGINIGGSYVSANTTNGVVALRCDGAGQIFLNSGSEYGGTYTDTIVNVMKNTLSDTNQVKFRDTVNENNASLSETSGELNVKSNVDAKDITLETKTTGVIRIKNQTTNTDTQLNVQGNGSGIPKINLSNDTKAVTIQCDESQKLKVDSGGGNTFVIDVSTATSGITFPDGTTQVTAASGGGSPGGSTNDMQVNNGGSFEGAGGFEYDTDSTSPNSYRHVSIDPTQTFSPQGDWSLAVFGDTGSSSSIQGALYASGIFQVFGDSYFLGGFGATKNAIKLFQTNNTSNYMAFAPPSTITTSTILTLPDGDGSANQLLKTDGSGNLGWTNPKALAGTPASSTATGIAGELQYDADYLYVCIAANTWKRVAISTW